MFCLMCCDLPVWAVIFGSKYCAFLLTTTISTPSKMHITMATFDKTIMFWKKNMLGCSVLERTIPFWPLKNEVWSRDMRNRGLDSLVFFKGEWKITPLKGISVITAHQEFLRYTSNRATQPIGWWSLDHMYPIWMEYLWIIMPLQKSHR